jgi:hypothetical protein
MVVQICNSSMLEVEAGESRGRHQPGLHSKTQSQKKKKMVEKYNRE